MENCQFLLGGCPGIATPGSFSLITSQLATNVFYWGVGIISILLVIYLLIQILNLIKDPENKKKFTKNMFLAILSWLLFLILLFPLIKAIFAII